MHHAAGDGAGIADLDGVSESPQVIGGGQPAGSGTDDQDTAAGIRAMGREIPALLERQIAEVAFDAVNADRDVDPHAVAAVLAGVIADPAMDGGQGIVRYENLPGLTEPSILGGVQPGLDVLARGAGVIAWGQEIDVARLAAASRARELSVVKVGRPGQVVLG
jgi:hypothetical protein